MDIIEFSNIDNVYLMDNYDSSICVEGKLHVTVTHLIFRTNNQSREIWIPIHLVSSIDSPIFSSKGKILIIKCKDFHVYRFTIQDNSSCDKLKSVITKLIEDIDQHHKLPCFSMNDKGISKSLGIKSTNQRLVDSFSRMGIPNIQWKLTEINKDHKISDTYPSVLVVPNVISLSILKACSKFRSRGRLPVLTYFHKPTKAAMCRCSQPLVGFSARCNEDITMLKRIKDAANNDHRDVLHVIDTRPKINALTNKAKGKGYESELDYEKIAFQFFDIENIHVMRSSLERLLKACRRMNQASSQFISAIERSGWLKHIKIILDTSFTIANKLNLGENVVVHCSDGWDRTSQVCGIAQVILDPHYRTFDGLEELIEKDWLAFGHKFSDRCGHISGMDPTEVAPVFTQFLDCLYQLCNFYPDQFQYNERLLRHMHRWSQDCQFGTFIGNCEKDRIDLNIYDQCPSVWTFIKDNQWDYCNPFYDPDLTVPVLEYVVPTCDLTIWMSLYSPNEDISSISVSSVSIPDHLFTLQKLTKSVDYHNAHMFQKAKKILRWLQSKNPALESIENFSSITNRLTDLERQVVTVDDCDNIDGNPDQQFFTNNSTDWSVSADICSVANACPALKLQKKCFECHRQFVPLSHNNLCYRCGEFFCVMCISAKTNLIGHGSVEDLFPVCKTCNQKSEFIRQRPDNNNTELCNQRLTNGNSHISMDPLLDLLQQQQQPRHDNSSDPLCTN